MSIEKQPDPELPKPPDFKRHLDLYNYQYIAIPLLLLIPILALFGVFGETGAITTAESAGFSLEVHYPDRMHAGMGNEINIKAANRTSEVLPVLEISVDHSYLEKFVDVRFTPDLTRMNEDHAVVELHDIRPGETRVVSVELQGLWVGTQTATITASAGADAQVSTTISTFVFP